MYFNHYTYFCLSIFLFQSKRYANDEEEEKAAEESIQREAFERSRASGIQMSILAPNMSMFSYAANKTADEDEYAPDDFGGGFDDDDDNEDPDFDNFIATDNNAEKYASVSFAEDEMKENDDIPVYSIEKKTANMDFLDVICQDGALNTGGEYKFFDTAAIDKIIGDQWAGSSHWKKSARLRTKPKRFTQEQEKEQKQSDQKGNDQKRKRKNETKDVKAKSLIDLKSCHKCLDRLIKENKKTKGKKSDTDQSQFTKAIKQKHTNEKNILPYDAEISMKQFSTLFMRPGDVVSEFISARKTPRKSVGKNKNSYLDSRDILANCSSNNHFFCFALFRFL